jgi:hypothetical protein
MYDQETNSYWSHILGEAKQSPLRGKTLEPVSSVMTDWKNWSKRHPDGTVALLSRTSQEYRTEFYHNPEVFVLGIAGGGKAKAWGFDALSRTPAVNEQWDGQPVVVLFDRPSVTARLYSRKLQDRVLTFEAAGEAVKDKETGSTWEPVTGRDVAGPLAGQHLTALPAIVSYRNTWLQFHPRSEVSPPNRN